MTRPLLVFACLVVLVGCGRESATATPPAASTQAVAAPANATNPLASIALTDLDGRPAPLNTWQNKIIVANYWATWCAPCRAEMPEFSAVHTAYAARGVQFLGISLDEADAVKRYSTATPVSYPLLIAPLSAIEPTVALGNTAAALPFTIILDRQGRVVATRLGRFHQADLEATLSRLL
jgi:thiol-disulfide isomerase/thioredoxin